MLFGHSTPQSMLFGHNTPQSLLLGHSTPQSMLFGHSTPQSMLFGHSTPQSMLFGHSTPQSMLFGQGVVYPGTRFFKNLSGGSVSIGFQYPNPGPAIRRKVQGYYYIRQPHPGMGTFPEWVRFWIKSKTHSKCPGSLAVARTLFSQPAKTEFRV